MSLWGVITVTTSLWVVAADVLPADEWRLVTKFANATYTHRVTLPNATAFPAPWPLVLYFHGWGEDADSPSGEAFASLAALSGLAVARLQGSGREGWRSWHGFGSVESPGPDGPTCVEATSPSYCGEYASCRDAATCHPCWWTTCVDSVGLALAALDAIETAFSSATLKTDAVWATGCSNGAMFLHELAADARSAPRLRGVASVVGLPHNGFNRGAVGGNRALHYLGVWGKRDTTCPPFPPANATRQDKTLDTWYDGWYYSSARNTTALWRRQAIDACNGGGGVSGLDGTDDDDDDWVVPEEGCAQFDAPCDAAGDVRACVFDTGHVCKNRHQLAEVRDFIVDRLPPVGPDGRRWPTPTICNDNGTVACRDAGGGENGPAGRRRPPGARLVFFLAAALGFVAGFVGGAAVAFRAARRWCEPPGASSRPGDSRDASEADTARVATPDDALVHVTEATSFVELPSAMLSASTDGTHGSHSVRAASSSRTTRARAPASSSSSSSLGAYDNAAATKSATVSPPASPPRDESLVAAAIVAEEEASCERRALV